jgi:hypothetical protein
MRVLETGIAKIESVLAEDAVAEVVKLGSQLVHVGFVTSVTALAGPELETTSATAFETSLVVASSAKTVPPQATLGTVPPQENLGTVPLQAISAKGLPQATLATTVHVLQSVTIRCEAA